MGSVSGSTTCAQPEQLAGEQGKVTQDRARPLRHSKIQDDARSYTQEDSDETRERRIGPERHGNRLKSRAIGAGWVVGLSLGATIS